VFLELIPVVRVNNPAAIIEIIANNTSLLLICKHSSRNVLLLGLSVLRDIL